MATGGQPQPQCSLDTVVRR